VGKCRLNLYSSAIINTHFVLIAAINGALWKLVVSHATLVYVTPGGAFCLNSLEIFQNDPVLDVMMH
jgi:hypothetical protein